MLHCNRWDCIKTVCYVFICFCFVFFSYGFLKLYLFTLFFFGLIILFYVRRELNYFQEQGCFSSVGISLFLPSPCSCLCGLERCWSPCVKDIPLSPRFKTLFNLDLTLLWGAEERSQFCTCSVTGFCFYVQWWISDPCWARRCFLKLHFGILTRVAASEPALGLGKVLCCCHITVLFLEKKNEISSKQELVGVCCGKGGREDDNFLHYLGETEGWWEKWGRGEKVCS